MEVEPDKLAAAKVPLDDVMEVTAGALDAGILKFSEGGFIGTGGFVETPNQRLGIRHQLPIVTPRGSRDGAARRARREDAAHRRRRQRGPGDAALAGDAVINDGPGLMLVVEKLPWGNTLEVTEGVEKAIDDMRPGLPKLRDRHDDLPTGELRRGGHRPPHVVTGPRRDPRRRGVGASSSWTGGPRLISAITMPLSLIATIFVLHARGVTINTMVLAGLVIALGAIVDDAIVDVENIVRRLRLARAAGSTAVDRIDHPRLLAGGPWRRRLRVAHRGARAPADLLPPEPDRILLQAARVHLRAGRARVAAWSR